MAMKGLIKIKRQNTNCFSVLYTVCNCKEEDVCIQQFHGKTWLKATTWQAQA